MAAFEGNHLSKNKLSETFIKDFLILLKIYIPMENKLTY